MGESDLETTQKKAKRLGIPLIFLDESGSRAATGGRLPMLRMVVHDVTFIVKATAKPGAVRPCGSHLGLITMTPLKRKLNFRFTIFEGAINTEDVIFFLTMVHEYYGGKVMYGIETEAFKRSREETTLELLWSGFELIEKRLDRLDAEERTASEREVIRVLRGYLTYHSGRLRYRERLAAGKSIGSGQVEGDCKNLIGKRLKQTGARWRVRRANNMATLCAVLYGDQWEKYWSVAK